MRKRLAMLARKQIKHIPPESGCNSRQTTQINGSRKASIGALPSEESEWMDAHISGLNFVHRLEVLDEEEERLSGSLGYAIEGSSVLAGSSRGGTEHGRESLAARSSPYRRGNLINTLIDYEPREVEALPKAIESDKAAKMMLRRKQRAHNEFFASVGEELDQTKL